MRQAPQIRRYEDTFGSSSIVNEVDDEAIVLAGVRGQAETTADL